MIDALSNVLFIYILRHAQQTGLLNQGLLAALQDKDWESRPETVSPQLEWNIEQFQVGLHVACDLMRDLSNSN